MIKVFSTVCVALLVAGLANADTSHGSRPAFLRHVSGPKYCGSCNSYHDCTDPSCPFCASGEQKCVSEDAFCGLRCDDDGDCGGDCEHCSGSGYCTKGDTGTCLVECASADDCKGDCPVCSGDDKYVM